MPISVFFWKPMSKDYDFTIKAKLLSIPSGVASLSTHGLKNGEPLLGHHSTTYRGDAPARAYSVWRGLRGTLGALFLGGGR